MAHVCVVKTWRKNFGFAEADDGSVVHISKEEIAGMRLKPGLTVTCDLVAVEGHGGRVKGVNVSGEGIVPPDDEPTPEEAAAERAEWNRFKEEKIGRWVRRAHFEGGDCRDAAEAGPDGDVRPCGCGGARGAGQGCERQRGGDCAAGRRAHP
eukprot:TRINITY_DN1261_c0_g1_i5.p2 TRINITY_DN1261_c0_g1~~TRINITY_DN1261_c0_g1_i5.p2  ORF type:complete len:152 (+),score=27.34 TRINITY_DN1261_c0_g1_i5:274-729(+)